MDVHDPTTDWENELLDQVQGPPFSFEDVNEMLNEARAEIARGELMQRTIPQILADALAKTK